MDLSFFFFFPILRFLQDTMIEEWMILVIERERERQKQNLKKRCVVSAKKCYAMKPSPFVLSQ